MSGIIPRAEAANPYLIFHLDAISSSDFFRELEEGNLPNIEALFSDGIHIEYGLSLYPGGTEMIYPRLKTGMGNHEGGSIGWGYLDRDTDRIVRDPEVLLGMLGKIPRRSRSFFIYGLPVLDNLAALSMMNVVDILDTYGFAEILWFSTDSVGHLLGSEAHAKALYRFDQAIGRFLPMDQLEQVNIILYTDHGMSFGDIQLIDLETIIDQAFADSLRFYAYPNIYVNHAVDKAEKADELISNEIDFVFYRQGDKVVGHHAQGKVFFVGRDGLISYTFSGVDPFGYYAAGYNGEFLSKDDWLELTKDLRFPATPANVYNYLQNPYVGDFVVNLTPPKLPLTVRANAGNHSGLVNSDLLVPVLLKGPDVQHLADFETVWLNELFSVHVPEIDFDFVPERETIGLSIMGIASDGSGMSLRFSPKYRLRGQLVVSPHNKATAGLEYDVFSSFLTRNWIGGGTRLSREESRLFLHGTSELTLGKIVATNRFLYYPGDKQWEWEPSVAYKLSSHMSAEWYIGQGFGLNFLW